MDLSKLLSVCAGAVFPPLSPAAPSGGKESPMKQDTKWKPRWTIFLPGLVLGLLCIAAYLTLPLTRGTWMELWSAPVGFITLIYLVVALILRLEAVPAGPRLVRWASAALFFCALLYFVNHSLYDQLFHESFDRLLNSSGPIWLVLGIGTIAAAWFLSLRPEQADGKHRDTGKDARPPWEC
ncbi:MAG: hypothetical protein ACOX85_11410 [Candidatus Pararuminococcus gallinarum]